MNMQMRKFHRNQKKEIVTNRANIAKREEGLSQKLSTVLQNFNR